MTHTNTYLATRNRVEAYFDRTATKTWERLTSDAPVSGIRATVRAGRDRMRDVLLSTLPNDLQGARLLDAGCGTGAMSVELAKRGAQVLAIDISPALADIAQKRCPSRYANQIAFQSGDMTADHGTFDFAVAMDSMIYYTQPDLAQTLGHMAGRIGQISFTVAPRTPLLMAMWRVGKLFPKSDSSPVMVPHSIPKLANELRTQGFKGALKDVERVSSGFYISNALEYRR